MGVSLETTATSVPYHNCLTKAPAGEDCFHRTSTLAHFQTESMIIQGLIEDGAFPHWPCLEGKDLLRAFDASCDDEAENTCVFAYPQKDLRPCVEKCLHVHTHVRAPYPRLVLRRQMIASGEEKRLGSPAR